MTAPGGPTSLTVNVHMGDTPITARSHGGHHWLRFGDDLNVFLVRPEHADAIIAAACDAKQQMLAAAPAPPELPEGPGECSCGGIGGGHTLHCPDRPDRGYLHDVAPAPMPVLPAGMCGATQPAAPEWPCIWTGGHLGQHQDVSGGRWPADATQSAESAVQA